MSEKGRTMNKRERSIGRLVCGLLVAGALTVVGVLMVSTTAPPAQAWLTPCDFLTGGGWIVPNIQTGLHANFGVGGGCKFGSPTWGHLEYIDHNTGLNVHWTSITYYVPDGENGGTDAQPTGIRHICGTATTNLYGDVYFHVRAKDAGEPGVNDQFDIRLCPGTNQACGSGPVPAYLYDTTAQCFPHYLGSSACAAPGNGGGGNIQLHDGNPSNTGSFGGSCPQW